VGVSAQVVLVTPSLLVATLLAPLFERALLLAALSLLVLSLLALLLLSVLSLLVPALLAPLLSLVALALLSSLSLLTALVLSLLTALVLSLLSSLSLLALSLLALSLLALSLLALAPSSPLAGLVHSVSLTELAGVSAPVPALLLPGLSVLLTLGLSEAPALLLVPAARLPLPAVVLVGAVAALSVLPVVGLP